ncbi:MAG: SufS family cysteine desulfurase [Paracoccaceae bacterium]|jgi:cysteine desulfurase/selenocysteine lyase|tara:strand:- start:646 stop:1866 length:1221 start_codon:yes stop_codon:yes gene_type:complete
MFDVLEIRKEFPILAKKVNDKPLVYLDNGASSQKPISVIETIKNCYENEYSNVHRGLHFLSNLATEKFEAVREKTRSFLGAAYLEEIIFTSGSTEALNLVSYAWANQNLEYGDEIILSTLEHHANIVPWHFLRSRKNVKLVWIDPDENGQISFEMIEKKISSKTKMVCITHMSNVFGSIIDVKTICQNLKKRGIVTVLDGSQAIVHLEVDVKSIGCDFYTFTGHKLFGPTGTGVLYVNKKRIEEMVPFIGGGEMIKNVSKDDVTFNQSPFLFEAGTPGIAEIIGLGAAIDFVLSFDRKSVLEYEISLSEYARAKLQRLDWLAKHSFHSDNLAIFSFSMEGIAHAHDMATILDANGVAVRSGHHCAQPLMKFIGVPATCRASLALYNTQEEIDTLIESLEKCKKLFG